jgi:hypothetical protein
MKILIFNENLFYVEDVEKFQLGTIRKSVFLFINSNIIETNIFWCLKSIRSGLLSNKSINLKRLSRYCNISLNILSGVAKEYYNLYKPKDQNTYTYDKPFFIKKQNEF